MAFFLPQISFSPECGKTSEQKLEPKHLSYGQDKHNKTPSDYPSKIAKAAVAFYPIRGINCEPSFTVTIREGGREGTPVVGIDAGFSTMFHTMQKLELSFDTTTDFWCDFEKLPGSKPHELFLMEIKKPLYGSWNMSNFSSADINTHLEKILPESVTTDLVPLVNNMGPESFYNAFGTSYLACRGGGTAFRNAVAYTAITNPTSFGEICELMNEDTKEILHNLRSKGTVSNTEIACMSWLTEKNITVFEFDNRGNIKSDVYFDFAHGKSAKSNTVYIGCFDSDDGKMYFPLIRKQGSSNPPAAKTSATVFASQKEETLGLRLGQVISDKLNEIFMEHQNSEKGCARQGSIDLSLEHPLPLTRGFKSNKNLTVGEDPGIKTIVKQTDQSSVNASLLQNKSPVEFQRDSADANKLTLNRPLEKESSKTRPAERKLKSENLKRYGPNILNSYTDLKNDGILNLGNSCYVNATMQALLSLPKVRKLYIKGPLKQFRDVMVTKGLDKQMAHALARRGYNGLMNRYKQFHPYEQSDAHELISAIFADRYYKKVKRAFKFQTVDKLTCPNLQCMSTRELAIVEAEGIVVETKFKSLQEAVNGSFKETLPYICQSCGNKNMQKETYVLKCPQQLMIVSQLFDHVGNKPNNDSMICFEDQKTVEIMTKEGNSKLELNSFITHTGSTNYSGHYKAYVKQGTFWICFDDEKVSVLPTPELTNGESVYIQFYEMQVRI